MIPEWWPGPVLNHPAGTFPNPRKLGFLSSSNDYPKSPNDAGEKVQDSFIVKEFKTETKTEGT